MKRIFLPMAGLLALSLPASAQDTERFRMEKSGAGFVRMDTRTGEMSYCEDTSGKLVCSVATDSSEGAQNSRLEARISALEERLAALEARPGVGENALPSDAELERTLGFMERFFRRFIGVVKEFEQDTPAQPSQPETLPDRT